MGYCEAVSHHHGNRYGCNELTDDQVKSGMKLLLVKEVAQA